MNDARFAVYGDEYSQMAACPMQGMSQVMQGNTVHTMQ